MATGSSQATSPYTELGTKDLSALLEALYPVRAKYRFFGLQIGVSLDEIEDIETNYEGSSNFLLKILSARLKQEPALTCGDIESLKAILRADQLLIRERERLKVMKNQVRKRWLRNIKKVLFTIK